MRDGLIKSINSEERLSFIYGLYLNTTCIGALLPCTEVLNNVIPYDICTTTED